MNNKTNWIHHLLVLPSLRIESLCLSLWIYGFQILCRFTNHRQCSLFSTQIVSVLVDGFYSLLTWPIDLWKCPCFLAHKDLPGSSCSFLHHHRIRLFPKWPLFSFSEKKIVRVTAIWTPHHGTLFLDHFSEQSKKRYICVWTVLAHKTIFIPIF